MRNLKTRQHVGLENSLIHSEWFSSIMLEDPLVFDLLLIFLDMKSTYNDDHVLR